MISETCWGYVDVELIWCTLLLLKTWILKWTLKFWSSGKVSATKLVMVWWCEYLSQKPHSSILNNLHPRICTCKQWISTISNSKCDTIELHSGIFLKWQKQAQSQDLMWASSVKVAWHRARFSKSGKGTYSHHYLGCRSIRYINKDFCVLLSKSKHLCKICSLEIHWGLKDMYNWMSCVQQW